MSSETPMQKLAKFIERMKREGVDPNYDESIETIDNNNKILREFLVLYPRHPANEGETFRKYYRRMSILLHPDKSTGTDAQKAEKTTLFKTLGSVNGLLGDKYKDATIPTVLAYIHERLARFNMNAAGAAAPAPALRQPEPPRAPTGRAGGSNSSARSNQPYYPDPNSDFKEGEGGGSYGYGGGGGGGSSSGYGSSASSSYAGSRGEEPEIITWFNDETNMGNIRAWMIPQKLNLEEWGTILNDARRGNSDALRDLERLRTLYYNQPDIGGFAGSSASAGGGGRSYSGPRGGEEGGGSASAAPYNRDEEMGSGLGPENIGPEAYYRSTAAAEERSAGSRPFSGAFKQASTTAKSYPPGTTYARRPGGSSNSSSASSTSFPRVAPIDPRYRPLSQAEIDANNLAARQKAQREAEDIRRLTQTPAERAYQAAMAAKAAREEASTRADRASREKYDAANNALDTEHARILPPSLYRQIQHREIPLGQLKGIQAELIALNTRLNEEIARDRAQNGLDMDTYAAIPGQIAEIERSIPYIPNAHLQEGIAKRQALEQRLADLRNQESDLYRKISLYHKKMRMTEGIRGIELPLLEKEIIRLTPIINSLMNMVGMSGGRSRSRRRTAPQSKTSNVTKKSTKSKKSGSRSVKKHRTTRRR